MEENEDVCVFNMDKYVKYILVAFLLFAGVGLCVIKLLPRILF
ncbi:MAG: hypothetical protein WC157_01475 [Candidatus Paceibacterota bacterium]